MLVTPEIGARVWLRGVAVAGEALTVPDAAGEFEVQLGALHTRVRLQQVERIETASGVIVEAISLPPLPEAPEEIEVRGRRLDEALPAVEAFLDDAARAGRGRVRIIHGRGTGTLRQAVRELLASHPLVTGHEGGGAREGGEGVTVVFLASTR